MIKVLEEHSVPRATITCSNCGSMLEYGNADLIEGYDKPLYSIDSTGLLHKNYYITCPVCGCEQTAYRIKI